MDNSNSFFFSKILYKKVYNISGSVIGKLNDLILDFSFEKPCVKAIEIKSGNSKSYISADALEVYKDSKKNYFIKLNANNITVMPIPENEIFLARDFLDKQIVDINGRKVERVNDVRLGLIHGEWKLVAVDIGLRGILRRLGVEYTVIKLTEVFKIKFRNTLIYWDNVQPLTAGVESLRLSTSLTKLKTLHAADIADIIEELDSQSRNAVFQGLDNEIAAEVLEEVEKDVQKSIIETLTDEKASDILEIMPSDEAADILEEIGDDRAERLLVQMETESSEEIRELMEYEKRTVGSLMSKDFLTYLPDTRVYNVISDLKKNKPKEEFGYIYLVNSKDTLLGAVSLIDVVAADSNLKLYDLMTPNIKSVNDEDDIDQALELMQKYDLMYVPVTDSSKELTGVISINDLLHELIRLKRVAA